MPRYYNNPQIGAAFESLASLFAPPSGADAAGYAAAQAKRAEAARLAELYTRAQDPNVGWDQLDRLGFGINGDARMTFENADRDRRTELEKQAGINQTNITQSMLAPVAEGATRFVPPSIAGQYGVGPTQTGVISLGQGDTAVLPDGRTLAGAPKPLSETELKAQILGGMDPAMQQAVVFGNTPIEQVMGSNGLMNATRPQAVGQPAFVKPSGDTFNYRSPDGRTGMGTTDPVTGAPIDAATRQPIPAGSTKFSAQAQGTPDQLGVGQANKAQTLRASAGATRLLTGELRKLVESNPGASGTPGRILGIGQDMLQTARELGQAFGENPEIAIPSAEFQAFVQSTLPGDQAAYNPVYSQARALVLELAYSNARMNNPSGEVSRFALEREIEALGQGFLSNDESLLAVLDIIDARTGRKLQEADMLEGGAIPPPNAPGAPPAAAAGTRRRFNPATGQLEPVQ